MPWRRWALLVTAPPPPPLSFPPSLYSSINPFNFAPPQPAPLFPLTNLIPSSFILPSHSPPQHFPHSALPPPYSPPSFPTHKKIHLRNNKQGGNQKGRNKRKKEKKKKKTQSETNRTIRPGLIPINKSVSLCCSVFLQRGQIAFYFPVKDASKPQNKTMSLFVPRLGSAKKHLFHYQSKAAII